jgi:hypothetical protein
MGGVGCGARRGYVHADIYWNFYWWEAGGVVAGLVAEGDGKSYGTDGGVIVGDEAEFQNYGGGIYVETFVGREGKFFDAAGGVDGVEEFEAGGKLGRESCGDQIFVGRVMRVHVVAVGYFYRDGDLKFFSAGDGREGDEGAGFYDCCGSWHVC